MRLGLAVAKGRLWCEGFPRYTAPESPTPKRLTFVYPYYQCAEFFRQQVAVWRSYPSDLKQHVSIIVVDDGSPTPAQHPGLKELRLFRIGVDVPWNWLAARNIGAQYADDGWLLLTDMDHVVPAPTLQTVVYGVHDPKVVYAFSRREHTGQAVHPHSASFLMTRAMFWKIGGYDENLVGAYGTDGMYRKRMAQHARVQILTDELIRYEYVNDASVTTYERKTETMRQVKRAKLAALKPNQPPKTLSFPHHEVLPA